MGVNVRISPVLRTLTNCQNPVSVPVGNAVQCLEGLIEHEPEIRKWTYDRDGNMLLQVQLFVNGERIYEDEYSRHLQDGDELYVFLAISGG